MTIRSPLATTYITMTIVLGALVILKNAFSLAAGEIASVLPFLLVTLLASGLKVRLPGVNGTMSVGFFFVLIAIVSLPLQEALLVGSAAVLTQYVWQPAKQLRVLQVLFNAASTSIAVTGTYSAFHHHWLGSSERSLTMLVALGCVYFVLNTLLIAVVIALTESKPLWKTWFHYYWWSLPYYLLGAAVAGLFEMNRVPVLFFALPISYVIYRSYRLEVQRLRESYGKA